MRGGVHVDIMGRQVAEADAEVEVEVAEGVDERADGRDEQVERDSPTLKKSQGDEEQRGEDENRNKRRPCSP